MSAVAKTEIPGIDIVKFIMAIAVAYVHFTAIFIADKNDIPMAVEWFMRCAVPFFFITTGYLTAHSLNDKGKMISRGLRLFRVWALWTLLYLPLIFIDNVSYGEGIYEMAKQLVYTGTVGYTWHMWFIYSMAFFFIFECMLLNRPVLRRIARVVYLFCFVYYSYTMYHYDTLLNSIGDLVNERIVYGFQIILFGVYIRRRYEKGKAKKGMDMAILFVLSMVFYIFDLPCWDTLGGAAFFILAISIKIKPRNLYLTLRSESMWIYYIHMFVLFALFMNYGRLALDTTQLMVLSLILSIVFAWLLTMLQKRIKCLEYLLT